jgi:hypothetical protein
MYPRSFFMKKFTFPLLSLLIPVLFAGSANAQTTVSETDITRQAEHTAPTDNWVGYTRNSGLLNFVQGPTLPLQGCGSVQFTTAGTSDKAFLYNYDQENTPLSALTALSYATYQTSGLFNQVTAINIVIDYNGPEVEGGQAVLVFEPVYNLDQGTITANTWQTWDAFKGGNAKWWSTQPLNGVCEFNCFVTWNQIVANNPQATITGGFGLNQGSGNPGLICAVDGLTIGVNGSNTTYNFEGTPCPTPAIYQPKPNTTVSSSAFAYPNPTSGEINIQVPTEKSTKAEIVIINASGAVVESRKAKANGQIEQFDLSGSGPGLYLIQVITKNKVNHGKAIVQ